MVAIKAHRYGTRHLTAGEEYEVPGRHALALLAGKKARYAESRVRPASASAVESSQQRPPSESPSMAAPVRDSPTPEPAVAAPEPAEIEYLRAQAEQLGIEVDGRWGVVRLQHEIAKVR
jgi:hypothetical protein